MVRLFHIDPYYNIIMPGCLYLSHNSAEFWMIEPEMAFYDLEDNMNLAEEFIKYIIQYAMDSNREDLEFLEQLIQYYLSSIEIFHTP